MMERAILPLREENPEFTFLDLTDHLAARRWELRTISLEKMVKSLSNHFDDRRVSKQKIDRLKEDQNEKSEFLLHFYKTASAERIDEFLKVYYYMKKIVILDVIQKLQTQEDWTFEELELNIKKAVPELRRFGLVPMAKHLWKKEHPQPKIARARRSTFIKSIHDVTEALTYRSRLKALGIGVSAWARAANVAEKSLFHVFDPTCGVASKTWDKIKETAEKLLAQSTTSEKTRVAEAEKKFLRSFPVTTPLRPSSTVPTRVLVEHYERWILGVDGLTWSSQWERVRHHLQATLKGGRLHKTFVLFVEEGYLKVKLSETARAA